MNSSVETQWISEKYPKKDKKKAKEFQNCQSAVKEKKTPEVSSLDVI